MKACKFKVGDRLVNVSWECDMGLDLIVVIRRILGDDVWTVDHGHWDMRVLDEHFKPALPFWLTLKEKI